MIDVSWKEKNTIAQEGFESFIHLFAMTWQATVIIIKTNRIAVKQTRGPDLCRQWALLLLLTPPRTQSTVLIYLLVIRIARHTASHTSQMQCWLSLVDVNKRFAILGARASLCSESLPRRETVISSGMNNFNDGNCSMCFVDLKIRKRLLSGCSICIFEKKACSIQIINCTTIQHQKSTQYLNHIKYAIEAESINPFIPFARSHCRHINIAHIVL